MADRVSEDALKVIESMDFSQMTEIQVSRSSFRRPILGRFTKDWQWQDSYVPYPSLKADQQAQIYAKERDLCHNHITDARIIDANIWCAEGADAASLSQL